MTRNVQLSRNDYQWTGTVGDDIYQLTYIGNEQWRFEVHYAEIPHITYIYKLNPTGTIFVDENMYDISCEMLSSSSSSSFQGIILFDQFVIQIGSHPVGSSSSSSSFSSSSSSFEHSSSSSLNAILFDQFIIQIGDHPVGSSSSSSTNG